MEEQDPFDFLYRLSEISSSQEDLLRLSAFSGESVGAGDRAPPCSSEFPAESAGILLCSLPETQGGGSGGGGTQEQEDVFHTPPEKSSVPSSGDQPVDHCTLNQELGAHDDEDALGFVDLGDSQGTGCVNLGRDSDLGFTEVQPAQGVEGEFAAQSPRGIKRDAVAEDFEGFERESCSQCGICELPGKKSKLSEPKSGFDSSRTCLGIESLEVQEGIGNCAESPCNVGVDDVEPLQVVLAGDQACGDNEIPVQENAADELECGEEGEKMENAANELVPGEEEGQKKKKTSVFDVLKFLAENTDDNEDDDDDLENASLLNVIKVWGIAFPRPRWWPDTDLFRK